jgi:sigma-B regulation protein RsbU (phosphoserine phosphatase)
MGIGDSDHLDISIRFARLLQVVQAAQTIHSTLDLEDIVKEFLTLSVKELETEGGTIYLLDQGRKVLESMHTISPVPMGKIVLKLGEGIAGQAAAGGKPILVDDAGENRHFTGKIDRQTGRRTTTTMCFPLKDRDGGVIGVLQLVNKKRGPFVQEDLDFLQDLSVFLALAIKNAHYLKDSLTKARMDKEFRLARDIQNKTLPASRPSIAGYELADYFKSCYETAGDFYHYFKGPGGDHIVIIDVSGKGVGSAMVANSIHTFLSLMLPRAESLPRLASELNDFLWNIYECEKYATGIFMRVGKNGGLAWVNAGHTPLIHLGGSCAALLQPTGPPVGMLSGAAYKELELAPLPGDLLCLFTDGYNETSDAAEDEFGYPRIVEALEESRTMGLELVVEHLNARLAAFQGGRPDHDDRTLICLRKLP